MKVRRGALSLRRHKVHRSSARASYTRKQIINFPPYSVISFYGLALIAGWVLGKIEIFLQLKGEANVK